MSVLCKVSQRATETVDDVYHETQETTFFLDLHVALQQVQQSGRKFNNSLFCLLTIDDVTK